jgi:hypothetical protein
MLPKLTSTPSVKCVSGSTRNIGGCAVRWTNSGSIYFRQTHADAVASNIEQSVAYLAPRAQALTQSQDYVGDNYFPLYQGESFYRLWQHLSNTGVGIRARNTAWIYGPSQQRDEHWGSKIERSHVCD